MKLYRGCSRMQSMCLFEPSLCFGEHKRGRCFSFQRLIWGKASIFYLNHILPSCISILITSLIIPESKQKTKVTTINDTRVGSLKNECIHCCSHSHRQSHCCKLMHIFKTFCGYASLLSSSIHIAMPLIYRFLELKL